METKLLTRTAAVLAVAAALLAGFAPGAHAQVAPCRFQLGFADLARLLGPERAGVCREDQRVNPNGDGEQATSTGMLVWRKADNWTAFTDGYRTWLNGPNGLEDRLNTQRLPWEPDAGAFATRPAPAPAPAPAAPPAPAPLVPGTELGLPTAGPSLGLTVLGFERVGPSTGGSRLVKVTVKLEPGNNGPRAGKYEYWEFRLRSPEGVEYRPSVVAASRPGAVSTGTLFGSRFVVGDVYFEVPADAGGYGLHYYPQGNSSALVAISRWIGVPA
jgi:hypothetical protein